MLTDPPAAVDNEHFGRLATRGPLLAHGVGRLTIHTLGRRLGVTDESAVPDALGRLLEGDRK